MEHNIAKLPSPALANGLEAITILQQEGPLLLEGLVRRMQLPKTSVLRYLRTLEQIGIVSRSPDLRWVALRALTDLHAPDVAFDEVRRTLMETAARESGLTVEWYRGSRDGMALRDQRLAGGDVRVVARPGYLRVWGDEVDAVTRLGYAFDPAAPAIDGTFWRYSRNGVRRSLTAGTVQRAVTLASHKGVAADRAFNSNTIRRAAIVLRFHEIYQGILAFAEPFSFHPRHTPTSLKSLLQDLTHAHSLH